MRGLHQTLSTAILLATTILAAAPAAVRADQTDPGLPGLFAQLHAAGSVEAARPIEGEIWSLWGHSTVAGVDPLMDQATDELQQGDLDRALALFTEITRRAPAFAEGWNKRATVLFMMGRTDESVADIGRVLALEPRHFGALAGLGLCEAHLQHDQRAIDAFRRALAVDPYLEGARRNLDALTRALRDDSI